MRSSVLLCMAPAGRLERVRSANSVVARNVRYLFVWGVAGFHYHFACDLCECCQKRYQLTFPSIHVMSCIHGAIVPMTNH
eukprot:3214094-Pyramimonas_sp.AAC.1